MSDKLMALVMVCQFAVGIYCGWVWRGWSKP